MTISAFIKDIWRLIKDYKWTILLISIISTAILMGITVFVNQQERATNTGQNNNIEYEKIGVIDLYIDQTQENYYLEPTLNQEIVNKLTSWDNFKAHFSLHSSDPEFSATNPVDYFFDNSHNPIEDFLGIDPTQHKNVRIHPDTGNAYMTLEIDPETGNVRIVNTQGGFNDFRVQLDVNAEDETFASDIPEDTDDLMNMKIGMTPSSSEQFGYFESVFNWTSGLSFPRMFESRANFYIKSPAIYTAPILETSGNVQSYVFPAIVSIMVSLFLAFVIVFLLAIFNKTINYSFVYSWDPEDLYLNYSKADTDKQIAYDILQATNQEVAIISQDELSDSLIKELQSASSKNLYFYSDITEISLDKKIDDYIINVQRYSTLSDWYRKQQKHLEAQRNKNVKIVELPKNR